MQKTIEKQQITTTEQPHSDTPTNRPALRLVSTKDMSRDEWLSVRKQGIGASDAAAAVGLNPYQSQLELWMIKTGRDTTLPKADPLDENSPMYWGNVLEPTVAECYSKRTGNKVRRVNAVLQHPDKDKSWMLANLDYAVVSNDEVQILECKTAGEYGTKLWKEGVPEYVQCQVQHQLAVTGKAAADVCVLLCGQRLEIHRVERDDELIARLINLERVFWHYVETDTPPPSDGSDSSALALQHLYPQNSDDVIDFSEDKDVSNQFIDLISTKADIDLLKQYETKLKQKIQERMGSAYKAIFSSGEVTWKRSKDSVVLDTKAALQSHPELLTNFPLYRIGNRRFLLKS